MYICIDFDGTIVDHRYPRIGEPVPGAVEWLRRLQHFGALLILFTMRADDPGSALLSDAVCYLQAEGIELYGINRNPDQDTWTSSPKAYGEIYIDDAAFGCPLIFPKGFARPCVDWSRVGPEVEYMLLNRS